MNAAATRPRFTIVTPNWNGQAYLRPCLESVVEQNYPELEYIVVDGDSSDGSRIIIEEFRDQLSGLICEPDNGHADALNKGFAASTGEIMGWINSDDVILPGTLSFVARLFEARPDIDWITGRPSSMNADGVIEWMGPVRPWSRVRFLAGDNQWIQQESTFWRRSLWERAGGRLDTDFQLANDFELWCRFFRHAELHTVDRHLGCFRVRPGQRSIVYKTRYEKEARQILARELEQAEPDFRDAFATLLPDAPVTLDADARQRRDKELSVCDPPIIRASSLRPARQGGRKETAPQIFENAIERACAPSLLTRFKGVHAGQRCFIMGNGPSLNQTDLSLLDGETVFACNSIYMLFNRIDWRPTYYACVDSRVLPDRASEIAAMLDANPSMTGFFPAVIQEHVGDKRRTPARTALPSAKNRFYFNEVFGTLEDLPDSMFSTDIEAGVVQPHTVTITMLQIAAYMGFSEIYLIGCDTRYVVPDSVKADDPDALALTSTRDDDPNHFDPAYFGKDRKWHAPNTAMMIEHYKFARQALEARAIKVFNATVGGDLEVFDRIDYETLFDPEVRTIIRERKIAAQPAEGAAPQTSRIEAMIERAPARLRAPLLSAWRNRAFLAAMAVAGIAFLGFLALDWSAPLRPWLWPLALFALAFAFTAGVAVKARRLLNEARVQLNDLQGREVARELRFIELEAQLEDARSRLDELESAQTGQD
ncbi:glycosyltransferase [Alkalicaulis satelles]|nr:glycosyltransferase [Alkalicaulis satelles]